MKKFPFILLPILLFSVKSTAQVTLAYCKLERGCQFYQTNYSFKDLDQLFGYMGTFEKDKGTLVFFRNKQGQDVHYPDTKRNFKELHAYFGGKGEPSLAKGNGPQNLDGKIQPLDGKWLVNQQKPVLKNCLEGLSAQIEKYEAMKSGNKVFSKPFQPSDVIPGSSTWVMTGLNAYKVKLLNDANPSMNAVYDFTVNSPTQIAGTLQMSIKIPGQKTCEVNQNFNFNKN